MSAKEPTMVVIDAEGVLIGSCVHYPTHDGWKFIPATTSRRTSRKFWPSATASLPRWAFDLSEEMLTAVQFGLRQGKSARKSA